MGKRDLANFEYFPFVFENERDCGLILKNGEKIDSVGIVLFSHADFEHV